MASSPVLSGACTGSPRAHPIRPGRRYWSCRDSAQVHRAAANGEWLLLELDVAYAQQHLLPDLVARHLGSGGKLDYDAEVVVNQDPSVVIYRSSADAGRHIAQTPDASVILFDGGFPNSPRGFPGAPPRKGPPREQFGRGPGPSPGLWLLRVRHQAGSLEALVSQARRTNIAISGGILLLILATVSMLVHFSRRAQQLAELQINFVAGVSHELRTPLTVIRTAAYNLRGKLAHKAGLVEQYGELIQAESEKLGALGRADPSLRQRQGRPRRSQARAGYAGVAD